MVRWYPGKPLGSVNYSGLNTVMQRGLVMIRAVCVGRNRSRLNDWRCDNQVRRESNHESRNDSIGDDCVQFGEHDAHDAV